MDHYYQCPDVPVFLYGNGEGVRWYIKLLHSYQVPVTAIIDGKMSHDEYEAEKNGIKIVSLPFVSRCYDKAHIVISAPAHADAITKRLQQEAPYFWKYCFDASLEAMQKVPYEKRRNYYIKHRKDLEKFWDLLSDDFSRRTFRNILLGALTSDCSFYKSISNKSQYFSDVIMNVLGKEEVFVDIGAFTGDTIKDFKEATNDYFKKIYAFEPNIRNIEMAKSNLNYDDRIFFYAQGCGNENGSIYLESENADDIDEGSHVVREVSESAEMSEIVRLDDVIREKVTFIKMDIEGEELEALKGGAEIIKNYKPKLAISVYHKLEDLVEIPRFIMNLDSTYKLYLRHYWNCSGTDTILFAI